MSETKKNILKIILSALLFSVPFLFSHYFAWLIIFFLVPLFFLRGSILYFLLCGFLWGIVAYGLHFIWLYDLLVTHSSASRALSFCLYTIIVVYAAITSAIWFVCARKLTWVVSSILYFFLLTSHMFWFLGTGYPFINPLIPLMSYKSISEENSIQDSFGKKYKFVYLRPCPSSIKNDIFACASHLYNELKKLPLGALSREYEHVFVVGPETTFPFALNKNKDLVGFWGQLLPKNVSMLLGSVRLDEQGARPKLYQTVYWLSEFLIIGAYDKKHRVVFTEKVPAFWRKFSWTKRLFLADKLHVSRGKGSDFFEVNSSFAIRPLVCSELFFTCQKEERRSVKAASSKLIVFAAFVNDSWFCHYFRKLMRLSARFQAILLGRPVVYVGHYDMMVMPRHLKS